jgi:copper chaperone
MSTTTTVNVTGMTCGHCAQSVTNELSKVPGVKDVQVDLASGNVEVSSASPVDPAAIAAAVDEAGYEVSS